MKVNKAVMAVTEVFVDFKVNRKTRMIGYGIIELLRQGEADSKKLKIVEEELKKMRKYKQKWENERSAYVG